MSPYIKTHSGLIIFTEATTLPTPSLPYMTKTDFATTIDNTITFLLDNFYDNHAKQYVELKEITKKTFQKKVQNLMQNSKISFRPFHFISIELIR